MKKYIATVILFNSIFLNINIAQIKSDDSLSTKITKGYIINYIKSLEKNIKPFRSNFIKQLENNMEFDKMYMEKKYLNSKSLIIPIKKVYFSQHAFNQINPPIQYLVVVENNDNLGKIWRADFVLFFPEDKNLSYLPKNAFKDLANQNNTQVDGVYTFINWSDVKQYEMYIKNGEREKFKIWKSSSNFFGNGKNDCTDWDLIIEYYNKDQTITKEKQNLGKTCTECPPGFKCDPIKK